MVGTVLVVDREKMGNKGRKTRKIPKEKQAQGGGNQGTGQWRCALSFVRLQPRAYLCLCISSCISRTLAPVPPPFLSLLLPLILAGFSIGSARQKSSHVTAIAVILIINK